MNYKLIEKEAGRKIIDEWCKGRDNESYEFTSENTGSFIFQDGENFIGIINETYSECNVEEFETLEKAIAWINGEDEAEEMEMGTVENKFNQEDISYILEMVDIQGDIINEGYEAIDGDYDLHEYGEFVTSIRYSETVMKAWEDEDSPYHYWSQLFSDNALMKSAVNEIVEKIKGGK